MGALTGNDSPLQKKRLSQARLEPCNDLFTMFKNNQRLRRTQPPTLAGWMLRQIAGMLWAVKVRGVRPPPPLSAAVRTPKRHEPAHRGACRKERFYKHASAAQVAVWRFPILGLLGRLRCACSPAHAGPTAFLSIPHRPEPHPANVQRTLQR